MGFSFPSGPAFVQHMRRVIVVLPVVSRLSSSSRAPGDRRPFGRVSPYGLQNSATLSSSFLSTHHICITLLYVCFLI